MRAMRVGIGNRRRSILQRVRNSDPRTKTVSVKRVAVACALAPLLIPIIITALVMVVPGLPLTRVHQTSAQNRFLEGLYLSVFVAVIGYVATITVGLPAHLWLRAREHVGVGWHILLGVSVGVLPPVVLGVITYASQLSTTDYPLWVLASLAAIGILCGVPVALLFRHIALRAQLF
jgi:ABC-type Fe3+ transport system permease subunit